MAGKQDSIDVILKEQTALQKAGRLHWIHWLVLIASFILTLAAWYFSKHQVQGKINAEFDQQAKQVVELLAERMSKYEDTLWSGVAAIHSQSHGIDYEEWKRFSNTLRIEERYQGISGIGIIYQVLPENLEAFLAEERKMRPDFRIYPEHDKDIYMPITYIEPVENNFKAVGLDMAHEKNRFTAALKARDSGEAQITGPIVLVQDSKKTPGFLFYAPFYKRGTEDSLKDRQENFKGLVYAPFIVHELMQGTLEKTKRQVAIKISDGDNVLYDEHDQKDIDYDPNPLFEREVMVEKFGREWVYSIRSKKSFRDVTENNQPSLILAGGIIIEALLLSVFLLLARSNKRALKFAKTMTENYQDKLNELKESKSFQDLVLNTLPDYVFVKDSDYKIVQANNAFLTLYPEGMREDVIGSTTFENYLPEEANEFLTNDKIALEEGLHESIEEIQFPDGKKRILLTKKTGFDSGGERYLLGISHDITEMKQAEEAILNSNLELERFAYVASHDLQEPLRMVASFTGLLSEEYGESLGEDADYYMKNIVSSTERMQEMVGDLLEYSRIGQEGIGHEWVEVEASFSQALKNLEGAIKETKTKITHDDLPCVYASSMHLSQLLQNLIGNAIKYRHKDKAPEIHFSVKEMENEFQFLVSDNGIGMKEEYLEQIFVLFKRLHGKSEYSGTGIGLAICQKIVDSFGGKIWVKSELNKGSVFYFTIPKYQEKEI